MDRFYRTYWTLGLTLLLLVATLGAAAEESNPNARCTVTSPPRAGHDVTAFQRHVMTSSQGCESTSVTSRGEEVHVFNLKGRNMEQDGTVDLVLRPSDGGREDSVRPMIVILNSAIPVTWRIVSQSLSNDTKHTFMICESCRLVKDPRLRMRVRRMDRFPVDGADLYKFVEYVYKAVTSFVEIEEATIVRKDVGIDVTMPEQCILTSNFESTSVAIILDLEQPITGCHVAEDTPTSRREIHVIQVDNTNYDVTVDVTSLKADVNQSVVLVLMTSSDVTWNVNVNDVNGSLMVVTNATAAISTSLPLMTERRTMAGVGADQNVVDWVKGEYGTPRTYTRSLGANLVQLKLRDSVPFIPYNESKRLSPFLFPNQTRTMLSHAMTVQCRTGGYKVILSRRGMKEHGIRREHLSLNDPKCTPSLNKTHYILDTNTGSCGTGQQHRNHLVIFKNKVVIHRLANDDAVLDQYSRSRDRSQIPDTISAEIACDYTIQGLVESPFARAAIPSNDEQLDQLTSLVYRLELYASRRYQTVLYDYPQYIAAKSRLNVQADISGDLNLRVTVHSCWLMRSAVYTQQEPKHMLIDAGCVQDDSVTWAPDNEDYSDDFNQRQRFSFQVEPVLDAQYLFLHCQLTVCSKDGLYGAPRIQGCKQPVDYCRHQRLFGNPYAETHHLLKGPINVVASDPNRQQMVRDQSNGLRPPPYSDSAHPDKQQPTIIVQGLESGTVVAIAFAAFIIGLLLTTSLWCIHRHTEKALTQGKNRRQAAHDASMSSPGENSAGSSQPMAV